MFLALEITNNGISSEAFVFFTAVVTMLGTLGAGILKLLSDNRALKKETEKSVEISEKAVENTQPVSNGFANRMDRKLDGLAEKIDRLDNRIDAHLSWHLNQETPKEKE